MGNAGDFGRAVREARERLGWSQDRLGKESCLSRHTIWEIENGKRNVPDRTANLIAAKLGIGGGAGQPLPDSELEHLEKWRCVPPRLQRALGDVIAALAEQPAGVASAPELPTYELAPRRAAVQERRTIRIVGSAAARAADSQVSYDEREGGEGADLVVGEDIPEEMLGRYQPRELQAVRVRGESMRDAGLGDGDLVLCLEAPIGRYHRDDLVIAHHVSDGEVIKAYAGQRSGVVTLLPRGPGKPVSGRLGDELAVGGIVIAARVSGEWQKVKRG
jgi:transcriptional regulator with XRE-family HTH domain